MRPLWNHEKVAKAYKYLFCQSYRKQNNEEYENDYTTNNPEPKLKEISIEEVLQELENKE